MEARRAGPPRSLDGAPRAHRRHDARELLRELLRLPQPQERRPAAAAQRAVRPPARGLGPGALRRQRPGGAAPHAARDRHRDPCPLGRLPAAVRLHPGDAGGRARVLAEPPGRALLRQRAVAELAARRGELLPAAVARADLHRPGRVREPAGLRRLEAAGAAARPAHRFPARPGDRHRAEHRGVRVAARLDLLHGRARRAHPRAGPLGADRGVGAGRPDDHVYDLPRVALRGRRHRRRDAGGHGDRARPRADRVRRADPEDGCPPRNPRRREHRRARPRCRAVGGLARDRGRPGRRARHRRRRADHDGRRRRPAPRPRPRRRDVLRARRARRRAARGARRRGPRRARGGRGVPAVARGDGPRAPRALDRRPARSSPAARCSAST